MDIELECPAPRGIINAIPSKSEAHRALICAALSDYPTRVICPRAGDDIDATARVLTALGTKIMKDAGGFDVFPAKIKANAEEETPLTADCGSSGATLRFMLPLVLTFRSHAVFEMSESLAARPVAPLTSLLEKHGIRFSGISPLICRGLLTSGKYETDGSISSQFASGLLMALTRLGGTLKNIGNVSRPYIDMTTGILRAFGAELSEANGIFTVAKTVPLRSPGVFRVGGDWSDAAFFLAAGVVGRHAVTIRGLDENSIQGDAEIVRILRRMGARIECAEGSVTAYPSSLRGCVIDAGQTPDLVPVLAVAATAATGTTEIVNAARLRYKESNRLSGVAAMLGNLGGDVTENGDGLTIRYAPLHGGTVNSFGDHRLAMSAAVAAVICDGKVTIHDSGAVSKSHPDFWEDYMRLCR